MGSNTSTLVPGDVVGSDPEYTTDEQPQSPRKVLEQSLWYKQIYYTHTKQGSKNSEMIASFLLKLQVEDIDIHAAIATHFDHNKDGIFSYDEFATFMSSMTAIYNAFSAGDKNQDNVLSVTEIQNVLNEHMNIKLQEHAINRLIEIFDTNSDRVLDYGEFLLLYIFLKDLNSAYTKYVDTKSFDLDHLCKLVDNGDKAAAEIIRVFGDYGVELTMDAFACVLLFYKKKIRPPRRRTKSQARLDRVPSRDHIIWTETNNNILAEKWQDIVEWCPTREINSNCELFVDGIDECDVIQGKLEDCWLLGALSVLAATKPNAIRDLFVAEDRERGLYRCRFYKGGTWREVDVDSQLPCLKGSLHKKVLHFASCKSESEFWVPIIEKAYATMHGSYGALERGDIIEALKDLTGWATETIFLNSHAVSEQWRLFQSLYQRNCLMGCGIDSSAIPPPLPKNDLFKFGLLDNHAYSILKCVQIGPHRLLQLRNPWGRTEWNGAWSDFSTTWNIPEAEEYMKTYTRQDDGKFHMSIEDFLRYFNRVYVAHQNYCNPRREFGTWTHETAHGCHNNPYWLLNPRFLIITRESDASIIINLSQKDSRYALRTGKSTEPESYQSIGMYLFEKTTEDFYTMQVSNLVAKTEVFTETRDASLVFQAKKNHSVYVLIPCTFHPGRLGQFSVDVYSDKLVSVEKISSRESHVCDGRWRKDTGAESSQQTRHPDVFWLKLSQPGYVDFLLAPEFPKPDHETVLVQSMSLGIKLGYEKGNHCYVPLQGAESLGHSLCVSRELKADTFYVIEPFIASPTETNIDFKLSVFSNHVLHFSKYTFRKE